LILKKGEIDDQMAERIANGRQQGGVRRTRAIATAHLELGNLV